MKRCSIFPFIKEIPVLDYKHENVLVRACVGRSLPECGESCKQGVMQSAEEGRGEEMLDT